jgi:RNA polymerase sigma-70 factor (ECF subfamily)
MLYERYLDAIYRHVYYRVSDHCEAEDLTETIFLKAWQALTSQSKRNQVRHFRGWIYRIAHNEIVEYHCNHQPTIPIEHAHNLSDPNHSPEANLSDKQASQQLAQAIAQLEPDLQQVLVCRFIDHLSHAETAEIMDLKPGHVRVLQYRALNKVREVLNGYTYG